MRNEPCKQCGLNDRYTKGKFSYCRPCHTEAQKRYAKNKAAGITYTHIQPPKRSLEFMLTKGLKGAESLKTHCPKKHPYSGDNVRIETQQNGSLHRRCRTCERNAKRVSYGLAPEPDAATLTDLLDNVEVD